MRLRIELFLRFGLQLLHLLLLPIIDEVRLIRVLRRTSLILIVIVHRDFGIVVGVIFRFTALPSALLLPLRLLSLTFGDPVLPDFGSLDALTVITLPRILILSAQFRISALLAGLNEVLGGTFAPNIAHVRALL